MGTTTPTLFSTGAKEDLAVEDVYKPSKTLNKAPVSSSGADSEEGSTIARNLPDAAVTAAKSFDLEDGEVVVNPEEATNRLKEVLEIDGAPSTVAGESITNDALAKLGVPKDINKESITKLGNSGKVGKFPSVKKLVNDVRVVADGVDGVGSVLSKADLSNASGVKNLLDSLGATDAMKVIDTEGKFAVLTTLLEKAEELQIINVLDIVIEKIENDKDRRRFILDNLVGFFQKADLININKAMDYVGAGSVRARVPNGVNLIMQNYRYPRDTKTATEFNAMLTKQCKLLVGTLNRLDPKWNKVDWDGEERLDLEGYYYASPDAVVVLKKNDAHYRNVICAKKFVMVDLRSYAMRLFPQIYLSSFM